MAEIHAGGGFGPVPSRGGVKTLSSALGALTALVVGGAVLWWGWGLTTRNIDDIPVVRALDGPMKRRPADPGGLTLDTTDLSINSMLTGTDAGEVALAPAAEGPMPEDLPATRLATTGAGARPLGPFETPAVPGIADRLKAQATARAVAEREADRQAAAQIDALAAIAVADAPVGVPEPLSPADPVDPPDAGTAAPRAAPMSPARPDPAVRVATAAAAAAATELAATAAPKTLSLGDPAVQLGAYNSVDVAESQWARQLRRNEDLMRGHVHAVTTVKSGGRTLYRLRVGPLESLDAARNLCEALKARGDACNPVKVK
ncbi:MAG: cell division protein FtsN [Paracoccaceae bacterium]|jgi:cell division protein FtsN